MNYKIRCALATAGMYISLPIWYPIVVYKFCKRLNKEYGTKHIWDIDTKEAEEFLNSGKKSEYVEEIIETTFFKNKRP